VAENERVVAKMRFFGTYRSEFKGIAPTSKFVEYEAVRMYTVRDKQIMDAWGLGDL
jgi:predicted ester cyclase